MIIISNKGVMPLDLLHLLGVSTKRNDPTKIGEFGTGLKFALPWLQKNNIFHQLWVDGECVDLDFKSTEIPGVGIVNVLYVNGERTSITDQGGHGWDAWQIVRELYQNAIDENGEMAVTDNYEEFITAGRTTWIIEEHPLLQDVLDNQDFYFCRGRKIFYEDERIIIYQPARNGKGGFYWKNLLVETPEEVFQGYGFSYKLTQPSFRNDARILRSYVHHRSVIMGALLRIEDPFVVNTLIGSVRQEVFNREETRNETKVFMHADLSYGVREGFYGLGNDGPSTMVVGRPWSEQTWFNDDEVNYADRENPTHAFMCGTALNSTTLVRGETRKWVRSDKDFLQKRVNNITSVLFRRFHDLIEFKISFTVGVCQKKGIGIQEWKGVQWISESLAGDSPELLAAKMLSYLTMDIGNVNGEKMAQYILGNHLDEIRNAVSS